MWEGCCFGRMLAGEGAGVRSDAQPENIGSEKVVDSEDAALGRDVALGGMRV